MKGTIHLIHKSDNLWIFKIDIDNVTIRYPFIHNDPNLENGQEIIGEIINIGGVECIKKKFNS